MMRLNFYRFVRPSALGAMAAMLSLALIPACGNNNNDDAPRVTGVVSANPFNGAIGAFGVGGVVRATVQDPSNSNATTVLDVTLSQTPAWNQSSQPFGARFYQIQSYYNPQTARLALMLAWAPPGAPLPQAVRVQIFNVNPATGIATQASSSGASNDWKDLTDPRVTQTVGPL